ncbi:MAG TPA: cytochrome c [Candidatus Binatia bacterium]
MVKTLQSLVVVLCLAMWADVLRAEQKTQSPHVPKGCKLTLPAGDAEAGKTAFLKMGCYSCHKVPGGDFPEARISGGVGPDLVPAYSQLPREFLAEAIINPHRYMSGTLEHYRGSDKVSSEMRDYSSVMSVRELLDIVEFLKQLNHKTENKP